MNLLGLIKLVLKLTVILTASPSMRGSTPLDVAAASVMDNNELALALREPDLEKVGSFFIKHVFPPVERRKKETPVSWSKQNQDYMGVSGTFQEKTESLVGCSFCWWSEELNICSDYTHSCSQKKLLQGQLLILQ